MQPGTPPRQLSRHVNGYDTGTVPWVLPAADSDHTKQFDGQLSFPTTDTRPDRPFSGFSRGARVGARCLTLDHA